MMIDAVPAMAPNIGENQVRALATTGKQRSAVLPNVPTAIEAGLKGYELDSWFGLYAPAGTPADVVQVLNAEVNRILQTPEVRKKSEDSGTEVETMTPQQFGEFTRKELDHWGRVIRGAKISVE
jgi:tripartite-type tricarboxylate transporter receptor subunit TctC